jgi:hypothetical protein
MAYIIERAKRSRYFPGHDGRADPLEWFVLDDAYEGCDGTPLCVAGPVTRKREAYAAIDRMIAADMLELQSTDPR